MLCIQGLYTIFTEKNDEAIVYYDKILEIDSNHIGALVGKGVHLMNLQNITRRLNIMIRQ